MGFRAPSAADVYRYLLRGDHGIRSLVDGFCLSIVVVNDDSRECNEFLQRHFVDLCNRTGDRIRFVFFSNQDHQPSGDDSRPAWHKRGIVGAALRTLASGWRVSACIDDERRAEERRVRVLQHRARLPRWRNLTPDALEPVDDPEGTHKVLGFHKDAHSIVPGYQEGIRFAKSLGISDHVPCIVVITDASALEVDVMPVAGMSADQICSHVKNWVDAFYDQNREALDYWRRVEDQIDALTDARQLRLDDVRDWHNDRRLEWQACTNLAELLTEIRTWSYDEGTAWRTALASWTRGAIPLGLEETFRSAACGMEDLKHTEAWRDFAATTERHLRAASGVEALRDTMRLLPVTLRALEPTPAVSVFRDALECAWKDSRRLVDELGSAVEAYSHWWRSVPSDLPAYRRLVACCIRTEAGCSPRRESLQPAYRLIEERLRSCTLSDDPAASADRIVRALAVDLGVPQPDSPLWLEPMGDFRSRLEAWLVRAISNAPTWLHSHFPATLLSELLPLRRGERDIRHVLARDNPVLVLAETLDRSRESGWTDAKRRVDHSAAGIRDTLIDELRRCERDFVVGDASFEEPLEAWEYCRATLLSSVRSSHEVCWGSIERHLEKLGAGFDPRRPPARVAAKELLDVLDPYDGAIAALRYPHRSHPSVLTVELSRRVRDVAGLGDRSLRRSPVSERIAFSKEKIGNAAGQGDDDSDGVLKETTAELLNSSPLSRLARALRAAVPGRRLMEAVPASQYVPLLTLLQYQLDDTGTVPMLAALSAVERHGLYQSLADGSSRKDRWDESNTGEQVELICARVGICHRPPLRGPEFMRRFMEGLPEDVARLSDDEVRKEGTRLRVRMEGYIRQVVSLYAPLSLEIGKRSALKGATLGPLTDSLERIFFQPNRSDPRWDAAYDRFVGLNEKPGWKAMGTLLTDLPRHANSFCHETWERDSETSPVERRSDFRKFCATSRSLIQHIEKYPVYPVCLRFSRTSCDHGHLVFEFEADPQTEGLLSLRFRQLPPSIHGADPTRWASVLYRQPLLLMPWQPRDDPFVVSLLWDECVVLAESAPADVARLLPHLQGFVVAVQLAQADAEIEVGVCRVRVVLAENSPADVERLLPHLPGLVVPVQLTQDGANIEVGICGVRVVLAETSSADVERLLQHLQGFVVPVQRAEARGESEVGFCRVRVVLAARLQAAVERFLRPFQLAFEAIGCLSGRACHPADCS